MPRPKRLRRLSWVPPSQVFLPQGSVLDHGANTIMLTMDELESMRLADLERLSQVRGASRMGVSRATFGRIVESARAKVARALVFGLPLHIGGGAFVFGRGRYLTCPRCRCRQPRGKERGGEVRCRECRQPLQHPEKVSHIASTENTQPKGE